MTDKKEVLAVIESESETTSAVKAVLEDIIRRGFAFEDRLLVLMDGAKGLCKAVDETFGDLAVVQRCQMHTRENVARHVKDKDEAKTLKSRLQKTWETDSYAEARRRLNEIRTELETTCPQAAASLGEGLEDTLSLHKLGLGRALRDSLETTNSIVAHRARNVKRWVLSGHHQRWCASIVMQYEARLKAIDPILMEELVEALKRKNQTAGTNSTNGQFTS